MKPRLPRPKPLPIEPGQRSVWDFPRPPAIELESRHVRAEFAGVIIASSNRCVKVLETSHPPVYFFPPEDCNAEALRRTGNTSFCEWKGEAEDFDVGVGDRVAQGVACAYPRPTKRFADYAGWLSMYAGPMDVCYVGDDRVEPQPGGFYGGWLPNEIVGPVKGTPGTGHW